VGLANRRMNRQKPHGPIRLRALAAAALAAAALAALPAAGHAAVIKVGSDLTKPANLVQAHGADALFFNTLIDGAPGGAMPAGGQITLIRVKGSVLDSPSQRRNPEPPDPMVHFQSLTPIAGGAFHVNLSSAPFRLPIVTVLQDGSMRGDTQAITGYAPVNLCVHKGDYVDLNDIGGHEWSWGGLDGMHVQTFSRTPDASLNFFTKNAGTNNGSEWTPSPIQGQELLLQATLATGPDATDFCPGGYKQHIFQGLGIKTSGATLTTSDGTLKLRATCAGPTYGACKGVLVVSAKGSTTSLGGAAFSVKPSFTSRITVHLTKANAAALKRAGGVARIVADGHDDPAHDSRAKPGVPVQKKKVAKTVTLAVSK
jgi:hypothetical protein